MAWAFAPDGACEEEPPPEEPDEPSELAEALKFPLEMAPASATGHAAAVTITPNAAEIAAQCEREARFGSELPGQFELEGSFRSSFLGSFLGIANLRFRVLSRRPAGRRRAAAPEASYLAGATF